MAEKYKKKALCASVYNAVNLPAREPVDRVIDAPPPHLLLTELRPTGRLFAGKKILPDGTIDPKPLIKRWLHKRIGFDSLKEFYDYVAETQYDNAIIIRDLTDATSLKVLRRARRASEPNGFVDRSAALLPLDIDDIPVGPWMANPRKTVDAIVRRLGKPFTGTSYVAQLTGTHGLIRDDDGRWTGEVGGDVMSVRIFFITARGISNDETKVWLEQLRDTQVPEIDASLGDAVHIIYLARPLWYDHDGDPLGDIKPCWLVKRKLERLPVPENLPARARFHRACEAQYQKPCTEATVVEAIDNIGKPLTEGGPGCIYNRLGHAARLLLVQRPILIEEPNEPDIEDHAWNLRDLLAQMISDAHVEKNWLPGGEKIASAALEKYLQDDVHRWIRWRIQHARPKTTRRASVVRDEEIHVDVLDDKRALLEAIGAFITNNFDKLYEAREAAKVQFEEEYEAEKAKRQALQEARKAKVA